MYAEVLAAFGVLVFLLFYLAEISNKKPIGIIASLLVILFALSLLGDTINFRTGEVNTVALTFEANGTLNTTGSGSGLTFKDLNSTANSSIENYTITSGAENSTSALSGVMDSLGVARGSISGNETTTYTYTPLTASYLPIPLGQALGFILLALGLYGAFAYSVDTFTQPVTR
jgi:hypothetical protein